MSIYRAVYRSDIRHGLFIDLKLNANSLEQSFIDYDEDHYVEFVWGSKKDEEKFYKDFKHHILSSYDYFEDNIYYEYFCIIESQMDNYNSYISCQCSDKEWEEDYKHRPYLRRAI